jgi:hypothetical protein
MMMLMTHVFCMMTTRLTVTAPCSAGETTTRRICLIKKEWHTAPVEVPHTRRAIALAVAAYSACALMQDRTVICWWHGDWPTPAPRIADAVRIVAGKDLFCAVVSTGGQAASLSCWFVSKPNHDTGGPMPVLLEFEFYIVNSTFEESFALGSYRDLGLPGAIRDVAVGDAEACVRVDGTDKVAGGVFCWQIPTILRPIQRLASIFHFSGHSGHSPAQRYAGIDHVVSESAGSASGGVGTSVVEPHARWDPQRIKGLNEATALFAGPKSMCVLMESNRILCWGEMPGIPASRTVPTAVEGLC